MAEGQFEELTTFDYVLGEEPIRRYFHRTERQAKLGPLTEEEEEATLAAMLARGLASPAIPASAAAYLEGDCSLWLKIQPQTDAVQLVLHNTCEGRIYEILSTPSLVTGVWDPEKTVMGASGQDFTETTVSMIGRPRLFFQATEPSGCGATAGCEVTSSFKGLDQFSPPVYDPVATPDTMGAVGPTHFVEVLNSTVAVFDRFTGEQTEEAIQTSQFFKIPGTAYPLLNVLDPRIVYDHQGERWIACGRDKSSLQIILAVSSASDPSGLPDATGFSPNWTKHLVEVAQAGSQTDYPTLGIDANGVYISIIQFHAESGGNNTIIFHLDGHTVVAIPKAQLYEGTFSPTILSNGPGDLYTIDIQPATNFDPSPAGGYAWFVAKGPPDIGPPYRGGQIYYRRLAWDGIDADWVGSWEPLPDPTSGTYRDYYDLDDGEHYGLDLGQISAPQKGDGPDLGFKNTGSRILTAVIRDNSLWTCQQFGSDGSGHYTGDETGSAVDRTGIQWIKSAISETYDSLSVTAFGRIFDQCESDPYYYYVPSLMVNSAGHMVVGFSASSETEYIGAFYSWRLSDGTTLDRPALIQCGSSTREVDNRWGDYSFTSLDPLDDGLSFWTVQEYAKFSEEYVIPVWSTWIARIVLNP